MFVAKAAHKPATRSGDFMFVLIEASQEEETRLFLRADDAQRRLLAPQNFREVEWSFPSVPLPPSKELDVRSEFGHGATRTYGEPQQSFEIRSTTSRLHLPGSQLASKPTA
jgi:hypothetical protein